MLKFRKSCSLSFIIIMILSLFLLDACANKEVVNEPDSQIGLTDTSLPYQILPKSENNQLILLEWMDESEKEKIDLSQLIVSGKVISKKDIYFEVEREHQTDEFYKALIEFEIDKKLKSINEVYKKGDVITIMYMGSSYEPIEDGIILEEGTEAILLLRSLKEYAPFYEIAPYTIGNVIQDIFIYDGNAYKVPEVFESLVKNSEKIKTSQNEGYKNIFYKVKYKDIETIINKISSVNEEG